MDERNYIIQIVEAVGVWIAVSLLMICAILKYGPTWIRAWGETGNARQATLITGALMRIDQLSEQIQQKERTIEILIEQQNHCRQENARLETEIRQLRIEIDGLKK